MGCRCWAERGQLYIIFVELLICSLIFAAAFVNTVILSSWVYLCGKWTWHVWLIHVISWWTHTSHPDKYWQEQNLLYKSIQVVNSQCRSQTQGKKIGRIFLATSRTNKKRYSGARAMKYINAGPTTSFPSNIW